MFLGVQGEDLVRNGRNGYRYAVNSRKLILNEVKEQGKLCKDDMDKLFEHLERQEDAITALNVGMNRLYAVLQVLTPDNVSTVSFYACCFCKCSSFKDDDFVISAY